MQRRRSQIAIALMLACACGGSVAPAPLPVPSITPNTSGWWRDKVVYEVFVRSFADSDGDGTGDLKGLTAHLDYLNSAGSPASSLGVDALWLMPIFPSPSYHGYDVTDYRSVNGQYGSLDDFDALVKAAHQRGIRILLDMVVNHSSNRHPWFADAGSSPTAAHRDWYVWSNTDLKWQPPWGGGDTWHADSYGYYYGLFCGCMPDLNLTNPAVEAELTASMKFWLARGVDGFRLDAVRYYIESPQGDLADQPATHAYLRRMRAALQADYPDALLVGEAWTSVNTVASYYGKGDELGLAFSFDLADSIKASLLAGDATALINTLATSEVVFAADRGFEAPFLSNHDQERVLRALAGDAAAMRVATATLFAMPGTPFIYYGEELGMQGGAGGDDLQKRTSFRWTSSAPGYGFSSGSPWNSAGEAAGVDVATEQADAGSLWNLYRKLISLRHTQPALAKGDAKRASITGGGPGLVAVVRTSGGARVLFVANYGTAASGAFAVAASGTPQELTSQGLAGAPTAASGQLNFPGLAARSYAFFSL